MQAVRSQTFRSCDGRQFLRLFSLKGLAGNKESTSSWSGALCPGCGNLPDMKTNTANKLRDGASCKVIDGTHKGKSGIVGDIKTGKTGHVSITVVQSNGVKLKTLAKNVAIT